MRRHILFLIAVAIAVLSVHSHFSKSFFIVLENDSPLPIDSVDVQVWVDGRRVVDGHVHYDDGMSNGSVLSMNLMRGRHTVRARFLGGRAEASRSFELKRNSAALVSFSMSVSMEKDTAVYVERLKYFISRKNAVASFVDCPYIVSEAHIELVDRKIKRW